MNLKHYLGKRKLHGKKIPFRFRVYVFALIMSFFTSMIVSAIIIASRTMSYDKFIQIWLSSFVIAWPIVFIAILIIAPMVNKLLDQLVEAP
jgi:ABC-type dipeptide/oligopeptide/nickel transport system permease component